MFETMSITFEIDTNMAPERIKEAFADYVAREELVLEGHLDDCTMIDSESITVTVKP